MTLPVTDDGTGKLEPGSELGRYLSALCGTEETFMSALSDGKILACQDRANHWGPLVVIDTTPDWEASDPGSLHLDESPIETEVIAHLESILLAILPMFRAYYWTRSRLGDVIAVEQSLDEKHDKVQQHSISSTTEGHEETVQSVQTELTEVNIHRDLLVQIEDQHGEMQTIRSRIRDDTDADQSTFHDEYEIGLHQNGTRTESLLVKYQRDVDELLSDFQADFDRVEEKLNNIRDILRLHVREMASSANLNAAHRNVRAANRTLELQNSIKRLTWVLLLLTGVLVLNVLGEPFLAVLLDVGEYSARNADVLNPLVVGGYLFIVFLVRSEMP